MTWRVPFDDTSAMVGGDTRLDRSRLLAAAATEPIRFKVPEERVGAIIDLIGWNPDTSPTGPRGEWPCSSGDGTPGRGSTGVALPLVSQPPCLRLISPISILKAGVSLAQPEQRDMSQAKLAIRPSPGLAPVASSARGVGWSRMLTNPSRRSTMWPRTSSSEYYEVRTSRCGYVAKTLAVLKSRAHGNTNPVRERCLGCLNRLVAH